MDDYFRYGRVTCLLTCVSCVSDDSNSSTKNKAGVFNVSNIEIEKLNIRSSNLKNLTAHLVRHLNSPSHLEKFDEREEHQRKLAVKAAINHEIGNKIGSLAYFFLFNKLPFLLFERFLPRFA